MSPRPRKHTPPASISEIETPPVKRYRVCRQCGQPGHLAKTCTGARSKDGRIILAVEPNPIAAGKRYVVCEAFEEPDGTAWIVDDVWQALEPTGKTVDGHVQWRLRRDGDGADGVGFPALHPFQAHDPRAAGRSLAGIKISRIGMGPGALLRDSEAA